jgi:tetratricopeptide (TPR) repeat protein
MSFLLLVVLSAGAPVAEQPWYSLYDEGVRLVERGRCDEAARVLERAAAARPEEGLRVPTDGLHYVDYLPHLYLAIASHCAGDVASARSHLEAARTSGVAARSEIGASLLDAYAILLREEQAAVAAPGPAAPRPEGRSFKLFERRSPVLSEAEVDRIRAEVMLRCGMQPSATGSSAPWYFHYEVGQEMSRRGDPQRALDAFLESLDLRPDPQRQARMYGMWFTDYLPFFSIAREHARLGNWECVRDALDFSERSGEVTPLSAEYGEFRALVDEARQRAGAAGPR